MAYTLVQILRFAYFLQTQASTKTFWSYWALFGPTGIQNNFGDLQMMSKDSTHKHRQLSFSEFTSIHASKPISKAY